MNVEGQDPRKVQGFESRGGLSPTLSEVKGSGRTLNPQTHGNQKSRPPSSVRFRVSQPDYVLGYRGLPGCWVVFVGCFLGDEDAVWFLD